MSLREVVVLLPIVLASFQVPSDIYCRGPRKTMKNRKRTNKGVLLFCLSVRLPIIGISKQSSFDGIEWRSDTICSLKGLHVYGFRYLAAMKTRRSTRRREKEREIEEGANSRSISFSMRCLMRSGVGLKRDLSMYFEVPTRHRPIFVETFHSKLFQTFPNERTQLRIL